MQHPFPLSVLIPILADPPELNAFRNETSWNHVKTYAASYGVAPLVAFAARAHVPATERVWCDQILTAGWRRHDLMLRRLEHVTELLSGKGIQTISLKGPLLALRYYTPPFLRKPSMDIDLAVREEDVERACSMLFQEGYTTIIPIATARTLAHHIELTHPSLPNVELHFRLTPLAFEVPMASLFERAETLYLPNGLETRVLAPSDRLLHLVLHLAKSRFGTLFHIHEVRRAFQAESPEVQSEAVQRAVDYHFCAAFRMADIAVESLWGKPLFRPGTLPRTWLHGRLNQNLYAEFERWSLPGHRLTPGSRLHGRWLDFQITDRPVDGLRALALLARNVRDQVATRRWNQTKTVHFAAEPRSVTPTTARTTRINLMKRQE